MIYNISFIEDNKRTKKYFKKEIEEEKNNLKEKIMRFE